MLTLKKLLITPILLLATLDKPEFKISDSIGYDGNIHKIQSSTNYKQTAMGISINLYRVGKAEKIDDLKDIEKQIEKTRDTKVDLYKMTGDLGMILLNTTDPFDNEKTIPYKMLFGKPIRQKISLSIGEVGGFIPSSEIIEITKWIKDNKVETFDGFSKIYDGLSIEVKKELENFGAEDKVTLFNVYVRPLVVMYFTALENENSIIFIGI